MTSLHTEHADEGQQHCCWESLRDYSFVKLKLQPSQTELLFRSVDDCFFLWELMGIDGRDGRNGSYGQRWHRCMDDCFFSLRITGGMGANWRRGRIRRRE